jgi:MscS family membrane protein
VLLGLPGVALGDAAEAAIGRMALAVLACALMLVAWRGVDLGFLFLRRRADASPGKIDDQVVPLLQRAAKIVVLFIGVAVLLDNLGVDVGGLVAGLGIGGLAVALAAKDTLANVFASLTLFVDQPFQLGEWIKLDDEVEGTVEEIGFRSTRIRTFHGSLVSVPNSRVADARIDNMGRRRHRRVTATLALSYGTPLERVQAYVEAVRRALAADPRVSEGPCEVHLHTLGASSLEILVYFFLDVPTWHDELEARASCMSSMVRLAESEGVTFAFPSTSVYVEALPGGAASQGASEGKATYSSEP